ncbi:hypothetical protein AXE80_08055 [Wenyingzhuangia fucanilytica]|uniref:Glycoside hydrolase family 42 N-terminal domain-containing protein n=1 Tax=Wenyingzhuangia fucanilytica TaxID=1790137 RepID=A0A1B1Y645_9FLAO|nr:T9SS type A sorting domain-containing protein [Wenyingzhuangia fucanilytica]ANW96233.1 hypothetical protein AXE80_08055 [Wenyingzhuangia fucanilytica]
MKIKLQQKNFLIVLFLLTTMVRAQTLTQQAKVKIDTLNALISIAELKGIDVLKEKTTVRTAEVFLKYANWDENNITENTTYFELVARYKDNAAEMANLLPDFERTEINIMLQDAIDYLKLLNAGTVKRKASPHINWEQVTHQGDRLVYQGKSVFLADYTWKPSVDSLTEFHGNQDGFFLTPSYVTDKNGTIRNNIASELSSKPNGSTGFIFLNNKNVPNWAEQEYGLGFKMREDTYTNYDIDNPGAKEMMGMLLAGTVPNMADKKYSELGYMLCNEPHFFTQKDGDKLAWASGPVSSYSIEKFKTWLGNKHGSIQSLNNLWGTSFTSFNDVTIDIPIDVSLKGTPMWYDWAYFNMYRVTEWYTWLKSKIREYDTDAKVHLKIMPNLWTENERIHGIDFETLTTLSDIIGNDSGSENSPMWGGPYEWETHYAFDWRELCMGFDFMKSVSPEKITYNTEVHYLSTGKSRNLYQDPMYARATFWLAHVYAMTASQTWFWARQVDGSIRPNAGKGYGGSNNQQPRIVNEVASTMIDLNAYSDEIMEMQRLRKPIRIFYSKTSAINKSNHMDDLFELYEAMHFDGIPIGFATKDIINAQDANLWDVILVHETEFATEDEIAALQDYLDNGGTIIIDNISLQKNEYGQTSLSTLQVSSGTIINASTISSIKSQAYSILNSKNRFPAVTINETNSQGIKTCVWRCVQNNAGKQVISVVNLGKTASTLTIGLKGASEVYCKDLLKGIPVTTTPTLQPNEVYFVEVSETSYDESIEEYYEFEKADAETPGVIEPNPTGNAASTGWFFQHQNFSFSDEEKAFGDYSLKFDSSVGSETAYQAQGGGNTSPAGSKLNLAAGTYTAKLAVYIDNNSPSKVQTNIASPFKAITWNLSGLSTGTWHYLSQEVTLSETIASKLTFKILDSDIGTKPSVLYFDNLEFTEGSLSSKIINNDIKLMVSPNPSTGNVLIEVPDDFRYDIEVYNVLGSKVKTIENVSNPLSVSLENLGKGVFFFKTAYQGKTIVKRIIIN